jgi:hypothetical protein
LDCSLIHSAISARENLQPSLTLRAGIFSPAQRRQMVLSATLRYSATFLIVRMSLVGIE